MEIDATKTRGKLTPEQRTERLKKGLCLYCGKEGHKVDTCPSRPSGSGSGNAKAPK